MWRTQRRPVANLLQSSRGEHCRVSKLCCIRLLRLRGTMYIHADLEKLSSRQRCNVSDLCFVLISFHPGSDASVNRAFFYCRLCCGTPQPRAVAAPGKLTSQNLTVTRHQTACVLCVSMQLTRPLLNCHMCTLPVLRYLSLIMPLIIIYDSM